MGRNISSESFGGSKGPGEGGKNADEGPEETGGDE